jgi:hypothetical protein
LLSAKGLTTLDAAQIAEFMGINLHVERPHENIPGVLVGELGGPLHDLVQLIVSTLNETGVILVNAGYANLGSFVLEALQQAGKIQAEAAVEVVLEKVGFINCLTVPTGPNAQLPSSSAHFQVFGTCQRSMVVVSSQPWGLFEKH